MQRVIIMGAAGRDFHNFNAFFRNNKDYKVVCFTASQIPDIADRKYPKELAGKGYPQGIPIYPEEQLSKLINKNRVDMVVLAYSDLPYYRVMHKASQVNAAGADFCLMGTEHTMLKSKKPVVAVTAVRTGCGKSQTTRYICKVLQKHKKKVVVIRHPMPYGDLRKQIWQRFQTYKDLDRHDCTIEEREEYEPLIDMGLVVYAGVDYAEILKHAEKDADIIVWDGGNNDFPFYRPDLHIVIADPLRAGHEKRYYPGEINVRMADAVVINKENSAKKADIEIVRENIKEMNPKAKIIDADSEVIVERPEMIKGKKVLVIEDGPTITHGGMSYGAGTVAARKYRATVVNPRPYAIGSIKEVYKRYKHLGKVLPAMGYYPEQVKELEQTINKTPCDAVIAGTPINLRKLLNVNKPIIRIHYKLKQLHGEQLEKLLERVR